MQVGKVTRNGFLFDGQSSRSEAVGIHFFSDGRIILEQDGREHVTLQREDYRYDPPLSSAPYRFYFQEDCMIEVPYSKELSQFIMKKERLSTRFLHASETRPSVLFALVPLSLIFLIALYLYAIPIGTSLVTKLTPYSVQEIIGSQALSLLDRVWLSSSALDDDKKIEVTTMIRATAAEIGYSQPIDIQFRKLKGIPNAFALLPETIILTDTIVELLTLDELRAVVAHEIGHLHYNHGLERIVRGSIVATTSLLLFGGDVETINSLALGLVETGYSREQEAEADLFAAEHLHLLGLKAALLGHALDKLEKRIIRFSDTNEREGGSAQWKLSEYLSSHPLTKNRILRMQELDKEFYASDSHQTD